MHFALVQGEHGWLITYYTKSEDGNRVIFEVSGWFKRGTSQTELAECANQRLQALQACAETIAGSFC